VQEYGQRLAHTLQAYELEAAAEDRELQWNATVGLLSQFVGGRLNPLVCFLEPLAARAFDADGSWEKGPDRGRVLEREDAAAAALAQTTLGRPEARAALARQAGAAFDGTARALGRPEPPVPPDTSFATTLLEAAADVGPWRLEDARKVWRGWHD
jgi:hypothetical protein